MTEGYRTQPGSERDQVPGATSAGPVPGDEQVFVTVVLRPDPSLPAPPPGTVIGRDEVARLRRASDAEVAAVQSFAADHGLTVVSADPVRRRVVLSGPAAAMGPAFAVQLERFDHDGGSYRGHQGPVGVPEDLAEPVVAVLGLDDRPQASTQFRRRKTATAVSYTPPEVAAAYGYPTTLNGAGHTIAFLELGGGYTTADLETYFSGLGLRTPAITAVPVDGGANAPTGSADGPDGEVMLDIEVAGSVANGASLVVYFGPNTDQGFVDAISAAVHDNTNAPAVLSISWGSPETQWTAASRQAMEDAFTDAGLAGLTVTVAAGDNGSSDGTQGGQPTVDYPAASPQVLACGGTRLELRGSAITSEQVWNDGSSGGATGGGVSATFPLPSWQIGAGVPKSAAASGGTGRGVPDVAGDADPETGYKIRVDGTDTVVGGTSAVAPLWAALVVLAVQRAGRPLGFVNPALYAKFGQLPALAGGFNDITGGTNGAYQAGPGWDPCTGLGSPKAAAIVSALA